MLLEEIQTNIKFILAKEIGSKERDRIRRGKKGQRRQKKLLIKQKKRIRRKQNEVYNRKDFNTSFFQEVIDHIDCKLKSQKLSGIPELATIYLLLYEIDCIDLHCLSRDFKKEQPISKDIDTFLTIRAGSLTGSVSCIPSHLHGQNVYHDDGYVYHIWQWTICSI